MKPLGPMTTQTLRLSLQKILLLILLPFLRFFVCMFTVTFPLSRLLPPLPVLVPGYLWPVQRFIYKYSQ